MKTLLVITVLLCSAFAAPSVLSKSIRITNGENAERDQYPYQAAFYWGLLGLWSYTCGASIISENWVVTAAHCITESPDVGDFRIRAGILSLYEDVPTSQTILVSSYVLHEGYGGGISPFDIAVLKLASPLTFSEAVQPIALPEPNVVPTGEAVVTGWGFISTGWLPVRPTFLQTATVSVITLDECYEAMTALFPDEDIPLHSTNVCTGPLYEGLSVCGGDSGGPLAQDGQLIGVVSWGVSPCGWPGAPSIYVQVSSFVDWINNNTD